MTSSFLIPTNGFTPRIRISQQHTPVRRWTEGGKREEGEKEEEREGGEKGRRRREKGEMFTQGSKNGTHCQVVPNIHTSLSPVNLLKLILSGAIHFMGNFPLEAVGKREGGRKGLKVYRAVQ